MRSAEADAGSAATKVLFAVTGMAAAVAIGIGGEQLLFEHHQARQTVADSHGSDIPAPSISVAESTPRATPTPSPDQAPVSRSRSAPELPGPTVIPTIVSSGIIPGSGSPLTSPSVTPSKPEAAPTTHPAPAPVKRPAPLIALDPGHSGKDILSTDPITHLQTHDYPNYPEIDEMFDVATLVKQALLRDGYRVLMLKQHARGTVSLSDRALAAMRAHANLAVSIHDDHSQPVGQGDDVYDQRVGLYRSRPDGSHRYTCNNASVAATSHRIAKIMASARSKTQHFPVEFGVNTSYLNRSGLYPGNLAMVQLPTCNGSPSRNLPPVPWVYNEMGAERDGNTRLALTIAQEKTYAAGIVKGIEQALPIRQAANR